MRRYSPFAAPITEPSALQYKTVQLRGAQEQFSFVLNDIMGFEKDSTNGLELRKNGVPVEDVKLVLGGRVREGYQVKKTKQNIVDRTSVEIFYKQIKNISTILTQQNALCDLVGFNTNV